MSGNNTNIPIQAGQTFTGIKQLTTGFSNILVSVRVDRLSELTIQQSASGTHWDLHEKWTCDPIKSPTGFVCQTPVALPYFRVLLENLALTDMVSLRLVSILNTVSNVHLDVRQDNTLVSGEDALGEKHTLATTSTGDLIINGTGGSATRPVYLMDVGTWYRVASVGNTPGHVWTSIGAIVGSETEPTIGRLFKCLSAPANIEGQGTVYDVEYSDTVTATPVGTQDVSVISRSGTGYLSYLTDNVAVATMPAITGTVAVSSQPHLSYLTDNVAVATMPAITGTVAVSSQPHLSYLTDNVAVTTQPALAFATDKVDVTGSSVSVSNFPATQAVSGSVALLPAVDPTLTVGTIRMTDVYGSPIVSSAGNLLIGISNIYTTNPLHTILDSGSVSVTGSVAVTNADITSIKTNTARFGLAIGSNYAETIIQTFTNLSITGGYLYNLSVYSDGSSGTNFLKVYGVAGATNADTPLLIVPVPHATSVNLSLSGLKALTGISVRATANYAVADNNAPTNGISCNLTFSPLV